MRLTEEILRNLGFEEATEKSIIGGTLWRIKYPYYAYQFQIELADYPDDNPNCGVLSLYSPEQDTSAIPDDLYDKEHWEPGDYERAKTFTIKIPKTEVHIAWHVNTPERLYAIIQSLTQVNL